MLHGNKARRNVEYSKLNQTESNQTPNDFVQICQKYNILLKMHAYQTNQCLHAFVYGIQRDRGEKAMSDAYFLVAVEQNDKICIMRSVRSSFNQKFE